MADTDESQAQGQLPAQGAEQAAGQAGAPPKIDIERLADKVYRLMLAEIRHDRSRGAASPRSAGHRW